VPGYRPLHRRVQDPGPRVPRNPRAGPDAISGSADGSTGSGGGAVLSSRGPERRTGPRGGAAGEPDRAWICGEVGRPGGLAQKLLGTCAPCVLASGSGRANTRASTLETDRGRCGEAGKETGEGPQAGF